MEFSPLACRRNMKSLLVFLLNTTGKVDFLVAERLTFFFGGREFESGKVDFFGGQEFESQAGLILYGWIKRPLFLIP